MELPLPSQSYQTRSKPLSSQRLVNLYCEVYKDDTGTLRTKSLLGTPGLIENIDFELTTPIYGASFFKNKIVFCIKNRVFEYDKNIEEKSYTVYNWENFVQPVMYSNTTYGVMSDSKNSNNTYKITQTSTMEGGVYPDEQGITYDTTPNYFVRKSDIPYVVKWKFADVVKITSLSIKTRLLPQNFITARFYLDEGLTQPIGDIFDNNANDGIDTILVSNIPAEGVETNTIYLAILSIAENPNSSCKINMGTSPLYNFEDKGNWGAGGSNANILTVSGDTYVICGLIGSGSMYISKSSDLENWSYVPNNLDGEGVRPETETTDGTNMYMIGTASSDSSYDSKNIFKSTNGGLTWNVIATLPDWIISSKSVMRTRIKIFYYNNILFIREEGRISGQTTRRIRGFHSTDNGVTWISRSYDAEDITEKNGTYYLLLLGSLSSLSFSVRSSETPPFTTTTPLGSKNDTGRAYGIFNDGTNFFITTETGLYYSTDDCNTWYLSSITESVRDFVYISDKNLRLVMTLDGKLYSSTDGFNWIEQTQFADYSNSKILASGDSAYFFSTLNNGKYAYSDLEIRTDYMPYIKLDGLTVIGEVQGEPITTYTRKYRELGIIEDLSSYVDMVDDGDHLFLLHSNGRGYYIEEDSDGNLVLKEVQDDADAGYEYQKLKSICYLAGRFIGVDYSAGTIRWTEVLDPNAWSALNYIQSETSINELTAIRSNTREAWVFSPKNIEVYTPTGSSDSPSAFARMSGAYIDKGCKYKNCIAINQLQFYWVATDGCIYRSNGYNAEKISTVALENEIMNYGEQEDILGQIYTQAGHVFYVVKFKTAKKTWCYDITTGLWHERESNDSEWKGDLIISAWNHTYVSDKDKSILYDLDLDVGTDNGEVIKREFVFPTIKNEELRTFHRRLEIDMDTGFSNNENLFLQFSDDGGYTWSNEYWVALGEKAEYNRKLEWRRLGSSITRIYRVKMSTRNKVNIIGAYIDIKKGVA